MNRDDFQKAMNARRLAGDTGTAVELPPADFDSLIAALGHAVGKGFCNLHIPCCSGIATVTRAAEPVPVPAEEPAPVVETLRSVQPAEETPPPKALDAGVASSPPEVVAAPVVSAEPEPVAAPEPPKRPLMPRNKRR